MIMKNQQTKTENFPVIFEQNTDGWFASCPTFQGCYAQGETYDEVMKNITEVLEMTIEDEIASGNYSVPQHVLLSNVSIPVTL